MGRIGRSAHSGGISEYTCQAFNIEHSAQVLVDAASQAEGPYQETDG